MYICMYYVFMYVFMYVLASVPCEDAKFKCGNEYHSMDHVLIQCEKINEQRELLKQKMRKCPASKEDLITKYKKEFYQFIESIDFDDLKV